MSETTAHPQPEHAPGPGSKWLKPRFVPTLVLLLGVTYHDHLDQLMNEVLRLARSVHSIKVGGVEILADSGDNTRAAETQLRRLEGLEPDAPYLLLAAPEVECRSLVVHIGTRNLAQLVPATERHAVQQMIDRGLVQMPVPMNAWLRDWQRRAEPVPGFFPVPGAEPVVRVREPFGRGFSLGQGCWSLTEEGRVGRALVRESLQWMQALPMP